MEKIKQDAEAGVAGKPEFLGWGSYRIHERYVQPCNLAPRFYKEGDASWLKKKHQPGGCRCCHKESEIIRLEAQNLLMSAMQCFVWRAGEPDLKTSELSQLGCWMFADAKSKQIIWLQSAFRVDLCIYFCLLVLTSKKMASAGARNGTLEDILNTVLKALGPVVVSCVSNGLTTYWSSLPSLVVSLHVPHGYFSAKVITWSSCKSESGRFTAIVVEYIEGITSSMWVRQLLSAGWIERQRAGRAFAMGTCRTIHANGATVEQDALVHLIDIYLKIT